MTILLPFKKRRRVLRIDYGGPSDLLVEENRPIVETSGGSGAEATDLLQLGLLESDSMADKTEGSRKPSSSAVSEKKKTGLMIVLKRKRVSGGDSMWEFEGNSENKKPKSIKSGESMCFREEDVPVVPRNLEKRIKGKGGRDIQMVIGKKLTTTDIKKQQARLLIPHNQMREGACFLTEEEKAIVNSKVKGSNEIRVRVMEPCGVESEMVLVKWSMQTSDNYSLRTGWNDAVHRNHLEANQFIRIWSFRVGPQLWFAIDTDAAASCSSATSSDSHSRGEPLLKYASMLSDAAGVVRKKRSDRMRYKAATTDFDVEKEEADAASCLLLLSRNWGELSCSQSVYPNENEGIELLMNLRH